MCSEAVASVNVMWPSASLVACVTSTGASVALSPARYRPYTAPLSAAPVSASTLVNPSWRGFTLFVMVGCSVAGMTVPKVSLASR